MHRVYCLNFVPTSGQFLGQQFKQQMPKFLLLLFCIFAFLAQSLHQRQLQASSITITASRSTQLSNLCTNSDRASLYKQYGISGNVQYTNDFSRFFSLDNTVFDLFLDLKVMEMNKQLRGNTLGYATYVAPAFVLPAVLLLFAPLLAVCLFCPSKCCLRRKLQYTPFQRAWPVVASMMLAATVAVVCFVGIFSKFKIYNGYQQLRCSGIIGVDDALYGASSYDGNSFFAGISTVNAQLKSLTSGNMNAVLGNLTAVSSAGSSTSSALNLMNAALLNISAIPDPSGNTLTLNYRTPFTSTATTSSIPSTFPSILGSSTANTTLVGSAHAAVSTASRNLSTITSTVDAFKSQSSGFTNSLSQMINDSANSVSLLKTTLLTVNDLFAAQNYFSNIYYVQVLFYGIILGLSGLYLLAMVVFACCHKMPCRHILYLLGLLLFLVAVAVFAAFFLLTFTSIIFNSGCNYLSASISDPTTFLTNVKKLGIDGNVASQYSVCLQGQGGDIISKLSGSQNRNYLKNLQYVMGNVTSFNGGALSNQINASYVPLQQSLSNYASANTIDIADSASIDELKYISNASNFDCSSGNFRFDSWIPSIRQTDNSIPCNSPSGMPSSDNATCTNSANFNTPTLSCQGCMGTFSLLYNATSQSEASTILGNRYVGCSTFNTQLANVWQNYYLIRKNTLGAVGARELSARQSVQSVTQAVNQNLVPAFQTTINQLYNTAQSILTPNYGVLWGLDCSVVGEDMVLFQQVSCHNTFSYSYFHRILVLIIGVALLLLLCCNTCSIFRRRKDIIQFLHPAAQQRAQAYVAPDPLSNARLNQNQI